MRLTCLIAAWCARDSMGHQNDHEHGRWRKPHRICEGRLSNTEIVRESGNFVLLQLPVHTVYLGQRKLNVLFAIIVYATRTPAGGRHTAATHIRRNRISLAIASHAILQRPRCSSDRCGIQVHHVYHSLGQATPQPAARAYFLH
jgi:hypothetical protein